MKKPLLPASAIKDIIEMGEGSAHLYKLTQQKMVEFLCKKAAEITGADATIMWNYDARRKQLLIRASHNVSDAYVHMWNEVIPMTPRTGLIGRAFQGNSIQTIKDISRDESLGLTEEEITMLNKEGFKTVVAIPYAVKNFKTRVVFNLYWRSVHPISAADREVFKLLQEQLYYSTDSIKHAFEFARQKPQITALSQIFGGGVKLGKTRTAFQKILDSLSHTLRARASALWLYNEDEHAFSVFSATGLPESFVSFSRTKEGQLSSRQGFLKKLLTTKKISFYKSSERKHLKSWSALFVASHLSPNYTQLLQGAGLTSAINPFFIAIPIFIGGQMKGALVFYFTLPRTHSESELHTLRVAAVHIGTALDNTRLYNTLAEESSKLEALFASLDIAVITLNQENRFTKINPWGERLFMVSQHTIVNKRLSEIDKTSLLGSVVNLFSEEEIRQRKRVSKELSWTLPPRVFEISATSVESLNGEFFGITYFTRDITQERLLEGMKTEFISLAAHQIRSPLTTIKWSLRSVLDKDLGTLTPQEQDMLQRTYSSTEQLIQLTKELLDVSRIEGGRFFKPRVPINLGEIVRQVIEISAVQAQQRRIEIQYIPPKEKFPEIMGDENAIRELFRILIENAIHYTLRGGFVRIRMAQEERTIVIAVQDSGIGIPQADQAYLFTRFFRATNARKATEGTGLGLYFAKKVVGEYKGKIWFESKENVGTTFYVLFPIPYKHT